MRTRFLTTVCLSITLTISARAQVPGIINYQGRVVDGGVNFTGTGQFKFALVDSTGSTTYWSNDGSSAGGSQPTTAVSLTVTKGLYSLLLGDATITHMTVIPSTVFNNSDVRLRVWFSDGGVGGFQQLSPDQRLGASGYALNAANVNSQGDIVGARLKVGSGHILSGSLSTIAGGLDNVVTNDQAVCGGGYINVAGGQRSTVAGGGDNWAMTYYATVAGGADNRATGERSFVGGGTANQASGTQACVVAGQNNIANNSFATVAGGYGNLATGPGAFVGGGGYDGSSFNGNVASGRASAVSGGIKNTANNNYTTVSGGSNNTASGVFAAIAGGAYNIGAGDEAAIGGGFSNLVLASAFECTIGGGALNTASNVYATISGGLQNTTGYGACATVGGGVANTAVNNYSTVGGGTGNTSGGYGATVPGGQNNVANGGWSFAGGYNAQAVHDGSFVWSDHNNPTFPSFGPDTFTVRCTGGAFFVTAIDNGGGATAGAIMVHGDTNWESFCDRNAKENFRSINAREVLERVTKIPITEWNMKAQQQSIRHLGPMAQDFHAAFGLNGTNDTHISVTDAEGVALAAIQGLDQELKERDAHIAALEGRLAEMEKRMQTVSHQLHRLQAEPQTVVNAHTDEGM